jgi:hypothetical protein
MSQRLDLMRPLIAQVPAEFIPHPSEVVGAGTGFYEPITLTSNGAAVFGLPSSMGHLPAITCRATVTV